MSSISIAQLLSILDQANIIDIRSIENYNNNHIPNAKNIPMQKLLVKPELYLNKNEVYYLYCRKGYSSAKVSRILNQAGYHTFNITGGYEGWILEN